MMLLFHCAFAALVVAFGAGSVWLVFFSPRRTVECYGRLPRRPEEAERIATAPQFVYDVETRAIATEGSDRPGILDMTPQTHREIYAND